MWLHSLFASMKSGLSRSRRPQPRPARRSTRLFVEQLEERALPSAYTAASVSALIADINAANKAGGANTITLTAPTTSPYALTARNNGGLTGTAGNGLPVIAANDNLTIVGNGDTIERTRAVTFRLFEVATHASLTLQNLTLQGGLAQGNGYVGPFDGLGGAIYNQGVLILSAVTVANNHAAGGAALGGSGGGIWSNGSLTLENGTLLEGNVASGTAASPGEYTGIDGSAGGVIPGYPASAGSGGAVYVAGGTANITNTTLTGNSAIGGPCNTGYLLPGGNAYGGALYVAAGQVILTNDTVNNNFASAGFAPQSPPPPTGYGAGLYVAAGTVTLTNDTVESNTVRYNYSWDQPPYYRDGGYGGGLFIASGATVYLDSFTVANTINNTDSTGLNGSTANIDGTYILRNP